MLFLNDEILKEVVGGVVSYGPSRMGDGLLQDLTLTQANTKAYGGGDGHFILVVNGGVTKAFG
jgi:hypothetical protein